MLQVSDSDYDYDYIIAWQCQSKGDTPLNREFIAASMIHVTNGIMYALYWVPYFKKHPGLSLGRKCVLLFPEFLNIAEASIYIKTATVYGDASISCKSFACPLYEQIRRLETLAAVLEMIASFGWFYTWYTTFPPGPGRGLTLWDPEFVAAVGLIVPSVAYVLFNAKNLLDPEGTSQNTAYLVADVIYAVDALFYLLAALRDTDCLWWLSAVPGCSREEPSRDSPENSPSQEPLLAFDSSHRDCHFEGPASADRKSVV